MYIEHKVGINLPYLSVTRVANPFSTGSGVAASSRPPILNLSCLFSMFYLMAFDDYAFSLMKRSFLAGVFRWSDNCRWVSMKLLREGDKYHPWLPYR